MGTSNNITGVTIDKCAGWLHGSNGDVGILLCSPFGLAELCLRRGWTMLATLCAEAGYPTLRFDYPGCGDSLGDLSEVADLDAMVQAAVTAATVLERRARVERIVLVGHGLGAAIAALAAPRIRAEGLALLAAPSSGRAHLRELELWGRWVAEGLGLEPGDPDTDDVGGFRPPERLAASIAELDLMAMPEAPAPSIFLAAPLDQGLGAALARRLEDLGAELETAAYREHAAALEAPTSARPPLALFEALLAWLERAAPTGRRDGGPAPHEPARLLGDGFSDTLVRFGPDGRLAGVLCEPRATRRGATALLLNGGGDPHTGWARSTVRHARALAARGVASFRIDLGDLGDSAGPATAAAPGVFLGAHVEDALAAVDWLETNGLSPVMPVGRCSGASIAFSAAARDPRVDSAVLVNLPDTGVDLAHEDVEPTRRLDYYLDRARAPGALLLRSMRGEIDFGAAFTRLTRAALGLAPSLLVPERSGQTSRAVLQALAQRGARIGFVYGSDAAPDRPPLGAEVRLVEHADNAFASPAAHAALLEILLEHALDADLRPPPFPEPPAIRRALRDPLLGARA
jgi:alpha-beta hydrolase superfamily lysophospholipase